MAKTSTPKLPKTVAGREVPKALRRGVFAELLNSPVGHLVLADALVAGAAAAATALRNHTGGLLTTIHRGHRMIEIRRPAPCLHILRDMFERRHRQPSCSPGGTLSARLPSE